jgi:hypothetical protein
VCRENPEAPPPLFCLYFCLVLRMAAARILMDGAYAHLPARDNRIPGHWITVLKSCLRHGPWLQSSQLAICFFQESLLRGNGRDIHGKAVIRDTDRS